MDGTWRKANGTKIADDGTLVRLAIETIDGRQMTVDMVPEMIPQLAAELMNAKFHAELLTAGTKAPCNQQISAGLSTPNN